MSQQLTQQSLLYKVFLRVSFVLGVFQAGTEAYAQVGTDQQGTVTNRLTQAVNITTVW